MRKLLLISIMLIGFLGNSMAQKIVTGTVTDEAKNPLTGVTVIVQGTSIGTLTNANGGFSLSVPTDARTLVFSFIGMKTYEVAIGDLTTFNVVMTVDIGMLEEVIVIGYGTVKKKDLTGAVTRLNAEDLQTEATSNMTTMLRGSIPGLTVNLSTTPKGLSSASDMLIRGETSLRATAADAAAANAPLIVVDGMIYYGDLSDINPVDIESFDVLKDASSAAIYGARASNGVILITTKKGSKGKPIINVSTSTGLAYTSPAHYDLMNAQQFIDRRIAGYEANERNQILKGPGYYQNSNNLPAGVTLAQWKAYDGSTAATDLDGVWLNRIGFAAIEINNYEAGKVTDFAQYTWQTGLTQDYNMSVSGSNDATSYYMSLGYNNNEGIRYNESFSTIRSRINLETNITDWLKVGTNTQIAFRDESPISVGYSSANSPYSSMYEEDGKTLLFAPSGYVNSPNFWLEMTWHDRFIKYNTLNSKIFGILTLPFGFTFTSEFIPRFEWNRNYQSWSSKHPNWSVQGGRASRQNTTIMEWQVNNILKWNKTFDIHNFDVTVVQNAEKYQYWRDYAYRQRFLPSDVLGYHRMQAASEDLEISSNDETSTGDALLGRVNYTLMSRYNITTSFRRDGYSAFGQSNPRASFWSMAGGWTISQENFFKVGWIDQLKLRFSYGTNGNRGVGIYDALSDLGTGKFVLITGGTPGYVSQLYTNRMSNDKLKWERTTAYNAGVDFSIFKGRLRGNIEAYMKVGKDLLIPRKLPDITGYASVFSNMGQVNNKGFEIAVNSINISSKDFSWTSDFSLSYNTNKIVHLYGDYKTDAVTGVRKEVDDITNQWFIGHAVDAIWDYKTLGIWQESETAEATKYSRSPGDYKIEDVNGDGYYTDADKQFLGYRKPRFRLTLRNNIQYKNWDLSIKMYSYLGFLNDDNHLFNADAFYDRATNYNVPYWTPANPGNKWARVDSYDSGFSIWENCSFVRIDNISLSYNIPQSILNKFKIVNCKVSVVSDNPFVWAPGWSWMDPENDGYTPSYISFKLNLTL
ncbi:MAG: SusC/RagA family TonB-linked outer membrane protein [Bacteroidales bacterium]|nr:SusC/RagA family TonB-linked outer membrane protein [Bacteroidales bacterium]